MVQCFSRLALSEARFWAVLLASHSAVVGPALADLLSPTYVQAQQLYANNDCGNALPLLKKYIAEDAAYLSSNLDRKKEIEVVINYCRTMLLPRDTLIVQGWHKPTLP